jgi:hypothetical protein
VPSVTDAQSLGEGVMLIQNLGPDALYVWDEEGVTADNGVQVSVGRAVVVGSGFEHFGISAGTSDVRTLAGGLGLFDADVS